MVPFSNAAAAYANAAGQGLRSATRTAEADGPAFGDVLKEAAESAIDTMHRGEAMTAKGVLGKADLSDVVNAVTNAEMTLQAVVNVRDRVISAYQEILRMPM